MKYSHCSNLGVMYSEIECIRCLSEGVDNVQFLLLEFLENGAHEEGSVCGELLPQALGKSGNDIAGQRNHHNVAVLGYHLQPTRQRREEKRKTVAVLVGEKSLVLKHTLKFPSFPTCPKSNRHSRQKTGD